MTIRILDPESFHRKQTANPEIKSSVVVEVINSEKILTLLEPGELGAMLDWEVKDPSTGLVMPDPRTGLPNKGTKKSESFVQQFLQLLFVQMTLPGANNPLSVNDTTNTLRGIYAYWASSGANCYLLDVLDAAAGTNFGIRVGTGTNAPTITDYALQTPVIHGTGAGQMQYGALTFGLPGSDATTSQLTITRNFTANVGGITVNELALYCRGYDGAARYFCIIRDVIAGGIVVPAGQTLTINYRPQAVI